MPSPRTSPRISPKKSAAVPATISGLYAGLAAPPSGGREELRLDVDGYYPQQAASGVLVSGKKRLHWLARPLKRSGKKWTGAIVFKNGNAALLPHAQVAISGTPAKLTVTFSGVGMAPRQAEYQRQSVGFRAVEFEYDAAPGITPVLDLQTQAHPDRPPGLPAENLNIETVYRRAGFDARRSPNSSLVPLAGAGANQRWSDAEMHDAMQTYWSRFASRPQWALWTFFAGLHEEGPDLGGIMFDSIGAQERQGTSLFLQSFIAQAPAGDPAPAAWKRRMAFWTAVHEMGHAFNLLHAWDKAMPTPWLPQSAGFQLMTYMNYPYLYPTGSFSEANTAAFFRKFEYRFTDDEILFLRHAPELFVEMGGEAFGHHHGLQDGAGAGLELTVRVNRPRPLFAFLEPVVVELKLSNRGNAAVEVPANSLKEVDRLEVGVRRNGAVSRDWHPFAHACFRPKTILLAPGESLYESLFLGAGGGGWLIAEPGSYEVAVAINLPQGRVAAPPLLLRVLLPLARDEENFAADFFAADVGRVLAFDGSHLFDKANATLSTAAERWPEHPVAVHALMALATLRSRGSQQLDFSPSDGGARGRVYTRPQEAGAVDRLAEGLGSNRSSAVRAAETLGHIDYHYYALRLAAATGEARGSGAGREVLQSLITTLADRGVATHVIDTVRGRLA